MEALVDIIPARGGRFAESLVEHLKKTKTSQGPEGVAEAWNMAPPPLYKEGIKVQNQWLYEFLLEPGKIRPMAVLRMPRFNMSPKRRGHWPITLQPLTELSIRIRKMIQPTRTTLPHAVSNLLRNWTDMTTTKIHGRHSMVHYVLVATTSDDGKLSSIPRSRFVGQIFQMLLTVCVRSGFSCGFRNHPT